MQDRDLYLSNNLTQSLTDVFTTIGETAQKTETPICFFIDEIQYMKQNQLGSLIAALHRTNQLGYPVMIVGAGLPKIYKMLSDEKSYSERLFVYKQVDSLTYEQVEKKQLRNLSGNSMYLIQKCDKKDRGDNKGVSIFYSAALSDRL